jgi:hypothetical protein
LIDRTEGSFASKGRLAVSETLGRFPALLVG